MRQYAGQLNRTWLALIGLLLLLGGLTVAAAATGSLPPVAQAMGLTLSGPDPAGRVVGAAAPAAFALPWVAVLTAAVGVLLAVLALAWLAAQLPRGNEAKVFRLHDTAETGLTRCSPGVLTDAVEAQVKALPGVAQASAILRGSAAHPDLTMRVTATNRADLPRLLETLQQRVAVDLGDALDTRVRRLGVQIDISLAKTPSDRITV